MTMRYWATRPIPYIDGTPVILTILWKEVHDEVGRNPPVRVPIFEKDEASGTGFIGSHLGLGSGWLVRCGIAF